MRAFLSVPDNGLPSLHGRDESPYETADALAASVPCQLAAEREARAILAVTEPEQNTRLLVASVIGSHFSPVDGYRYMGDVWTGQPEDGNAHAALAESLAAFVDASACAICGSPFAHPRPETHPMIPGTTRPESRPTIRTEGREKDGPLFTQDQDARERAEVKSQTKLF